MAAVPSGSTTSHQQPTSVHTGQGVEQPLVLPVVDAVGYLDAVKAQFHEQPEVYNKFITTMKEFKARKLAPLDVINRVALLFAGCPSLIEGFNVFLPPGYNIQAPDARPDGAVVVTTPHGTSHIQHQ